MVGRGWNCRGLGDEGVENVEGVGPLMPQPSTQNRGNSRLNSPCGVESVEGVEGLAIFKSIYLSQG